MPLDICLHLWKLKCIYCLCFLLLDYIDIFILRNTLQMYKNVVILVSLSRNLFSSLNVVILLQVFSVMLVMVRMAVICKLFLFVSWWAERDGQRWGGVIGERQEGQICKRTYYFSHVIEN